MNSEQLEQLVSRYNDPDLTEQERAQLGEVLRDNAEAQELLRQYQKLDDALAGLPDVTSGVDQGRFTAEVKSALAQGRRKSQSTAARPSRFRLGWPMRVAALVAVGLLAAIAYWSLTGDGPGETSGPRDSGQQMSTNTTRSHRNSAGMNDTRPVKFGVQSGSNRLTDFPANGSQAVKPHGSRDLNGIMKPLSVVAPEVDDIPMDDNAPAAANETSENSRLELNP